MLKLLARFLSRPAVTDWLIARASRTPYQHLRDADGSVYMERYWMFNPYPARSDGAGRKWGDWLPSIRLHRIMREDRERHFHDHPWNARTFILRGWYDEVRHASYQYEAVHKGDAFSWTIDGMAFTRWAGSTAPLKAGQFHRIVRVRDGGVWTLFITWRKRDTWGFLVDGKRVPWREYLGIPK
jgi:hypothetical protein